MFLACVTVATDPKWRVQVLVLNTGSLKSVSNKGEKQVLITGDQADAKSTHNYSLLDCWLDTVFLPFIST